MTKYEEIREAIAKLPESDVARLRDWLAELDAVKFDERIEKDAREGKLDAMMAEAKANYLAGRRREL